MEDSESKFEKNHKLFNYFYSLKIIVISDMKYWNNKFRTPSNKLFHDDYPQADVAKYTSSFAYESIQVHILTNELLGDLHKFIVENVDWLGI